MTMFGHVVNGHRVMALIVLFFTLLVDFDPVVLCGLDYFWLAFTLSLCPSFILLLFLYFILYFVLSFKPFCLQWAVYIKSVTNTVG